jgi:hypothetical protein
MSLELLTGLAGFVLTVLIFSYLIGDNLFFRIAVYLFIGVASGYAATVIWHYVLIPKLFAPLQSGNPNQLLLAIIPLLLCVTLLAKLSPRISWIGNFAMAILVGVGAATAVGGAVLGTLVPQSFAAMNALDIRSAGSGGAAFFRLIEGAVMLVGAVTVLGYFQFSAGRAPDGTPKRNVLFEAIAWVGKIFIAITFGVLFAGVYMAALTAMIERLSSIINFIRQLVGF